MKVSLNWLKEFVNIKDNPNTLANLIAEHCFEVEDIFSGGRQEFRFSNVYVAKVLKWEKHLNADRLRTVRLDLGSRGVVEPVVCGANNFDAGDFVALALPGANIPQNVHTGEKIAYTLGKATIRGVQSQGMICSAFELGLSEQPETRPEILILDNKAEPGSALEDYLNSKVKSTDTVLDLSLPANRPDLHSHYGIARELAAILGFNLTKKAKNIEKEYSNTQKAKKRLEIEIKDRNCDYYFGARLKVKVSETPKELFKYMDSLGSRSINNVVDITNFVSRELGQPLHAFDASKVKGKIIVRSAESGEKLETLDHKIRKLPESALVIADSEKALAIAGIIGGKSSEVSDSTTEIILESANFNQFNIRRTSKLLNLRTDASALWEKGLHARQASLGAMRAIELLIKYADAEVLETGEAGKIEVEKKEIKFNSEQINSLLGSSFTDAQIKKMLGQVNIKAKGSKNMSAEIPYYRSDMYNYADLADELLRIIGMNKIARQPLKTTVADSFVNHSEKINAVKENLAILGFNEVQNYSFISEKDIENFGAEAKASHLKVKNPLSAEQGYLKRDLLVPILKNIAHNVKYFESLALFEVGKAYLGFMEEPELLTFVLSDKNSSPELLLAKMKGYIDALVQKYTGLEAGASDMKPGILNLLAAKETIGDFGIVPNAVLQNFGIEHAVVYAKIELEKLWALQQKKTYKAYSRFPAKVLDVSLVVSEKIKWDQIEDLVRKHAGSLLTAVEVFDAPYFYTPGQQPKFHKELAQKGLKNMAFHIVFQSEKETLKDVQITPIYDKIVLALKSELNAEIR